MYQEHFGLSRPPFKITPDTSLFYEGNQRGAALDALLYAIRSGEGIIKVVGEVGSGKTMLCRMLEVRLNGEVDVVYIANPSLSPDNILHVIAHELHLDVDNETSKVDAMQRIQQYLLDKHAGDRQVVLFVEEAQSMPIDTLEEIRLLSNLETDEHKLLQMVLFGQPELDEKLALPQIRQLKERITHSFYLAPFAPEDTLQYLNFRLRAVGYKGPDIFTRKTANVVKKYSDGLTRRINIIADKSLLAAFSEGSHTVTPEHVRTAAQDSEFRKIRSSSSMQYALAATVLVVIAALAGYFMGSGAGSGTGLDIGAGTGPVMAVDQASDMPSASAPDSSGKADRRQPGEQLASLDLDVASTTGPADAVVSDALPQTMDEYHRISARVENTIEWLSTAADDHYSIQLFMARTSDADKVEAFLRDMPEMLDLTKIYIYETVVNGRSWYSVLYNDFATQDDAIEKLDALPASLKSSDPYLRRVSALKNDMTRQ